MSDMWEGATWNENGELVIDVYANPPDVEPEISEFDETDDEVDEYSEDDFDEEYDEDEVEHTYATIDCGGDCGGCVALIVDDEVVSGPPFHPNCNCTLSADDIENAHYHDSHLHQDVDSNRNVDTRDIKWLKRALLKLGYYTPNSRAGESDKKLNQYPNQRLFDAIENFRKENKIKETGAVKPGHWTEVKINEKIEQKETEEKIINAVFDKDTDIEPGQYATFNGKTLTIYQDGKPVISWDAVSGNKDFQSSEYQNLKSKGPIPEGIYVARQEKLQHMSPLDWAIGWTRVFGDNLGGKWPGSSVSWGSSRVWLEPSKETDTFGRDKFSIHGGTFPGSAGCIDLTSSMDDFTKWFENNGHDLIVNVKY